MNKYILCLLIGLILGILGTILFQIVGGNKESHLDISDNSFIESTISETLVDIRNELSKQNEILLGLNESISFMSGLEYLQRPISIDYEDIAKENITPSTEIDSPLLKSKVIGMDWVDILDRSLARTLVELGMTPYDPGVSPLIRDAGLKLRDASKRWSNSRDELGKKLRRKEILVDAYKVEEESLSKQYSQERSVILEALTSNLMSLKSKAEDKK